MQLNKTVEEVTSLVARLRQHVHEIDTERTALEPDSDNWDQLSNQTFDVVLAADWLEATVERAQ
jgi:hypothetical protein